MVESISHNIASIPYKLKDIRSGCRCRGASIRQMGLTGMGAGNRVAKMFNGDTTLYVHDASGNTLSVYTKQSTGPIEQAEVHLFGSTRLGIIMLRTISSLIGRMIVHIDCHRPTIWICN